MYYVCFVFSFSASLLFVCLQSLSVLRFCSSSFAFAHKRKEVAVSLYCRVLSVPIFESSIYPKSSSRFLAPTRHSGHGWGGDGGDEQHEFGHGRYHPFGGAGVQYYSVSLFVFRLVLTKFTSVSCIILVASFGFRSIVVRLVDGSSACVAETNPFWVDVPDCPSLAFTRLAPALIRLMLSVCSVNAK